MTAVKCFLWCTLLSIAGAAGAATLEVDDDGGTPYQTIGEAVAAASAGDEVFVHCGTYTENVVMRDGINLRGAGPQCTVVDGGQNGSTITMIGIGSSTVLEGFTLTNGRSELGGGIYIEDGSPIVRRNVITGNLAFSNGSTGFGGGIHITGPLTLRASTAPEISRNVIRDNVAEAWGGGIEIDADAQPIIVNNLLEGNSAVQGGGAIDVFANSFATIVNNTIVRNCLQGGSPACSQAGGGIAITNSGALVENNVIAWNEAAANGAGVDVVSSTVTFASNCAYRNLASGVEVNYAGVADPTGANGNISLDPLFASEAPAPRAFQPRSDSPLLDAGSSTLAPTVDLPGIPRPLDGIGNGTAIADIGARENEGVTRLGFSESNTVFWDGALDPSATFNLYRGDMQELRSSGTYTQDPDTVAGARRWCGLAAPTATDDDDPDPGQTFFYLAVVKGTVEGTLGFDSALSERPFTAGNRCP